MNTTAMAKKHLLIVSLSERFVFEKRPTLSSYNLQRMTTLDWSNNKHFIAQDSQGDGDKVMTIKLFRAALKRWTRRAQT